MAPNVATVIKKFSSNTLPLVIFLNALYKTSQPTIIYDAKNTNSEYFVS